MGAEAARGSAGTLQGVIRRCIGLDPGLRTDVAALYVDRLGPYPSLVADWYDEARDARDWWGPGPCVAHPPCAPWSRLRHLAHQDEPGIGNRAVAALVAAFQVRIYGGVLEHPVGSALFGRGLLPLPGDPPDRHGGYTIQVNQCDWGHPARKPTWLYLVRVPREAIVLPPPREPTHWVSGATSKSPQPGHTAAPPGIKICSAQQRRRTPGAFAAWLLELAAASSGRARGAA